jgi:hypothetical protein
MMAKRAMRQWRELCRPSWRLDALSAGGLWLRPLLSRRDGREHFELVRQTAETVAYVRQQGRSPLRNPGLPRLSPVL